MGAIAIYASLVALAYPDVALDQKQTTCLAHVVFHESRGESVAGQSAVAHVVLNRKYSKRYPNTICEVAYQKHQFTNIRKTKPDKNSKAWRIAAEIAAYSQIRLITDETNGATMYFNPAKVKPRWDFSKLKLVGILGGHTFFKEL